MDTGRDEQRRCGSEKTSNKQQLVVMSYSRYCRYRAQLQRSREERFNRGEDSDNSTTTDQMNTIRVLFCRDTYDYPAELLLQPFNPPHGYQHNSAVLANHMGMCTLVLAALHYFYTHCFVVPVLFTFFSVAPKSKPNLAV